ncbi:MAG: hypothetical protein ABW163_10960 [Luteimonas sp.]
MVGSDRTGGQSKLNVPLGVASLHGGLALRCPVSIPKPTVPEYLMPQPTYNPVILAEMTRAAHADRPDADWHELEPMLRTQWEQVRRPVDWATARLTAATHFRLLRGLPDGAPVIAVGETTP